MSLKIKGWRKIIKWTVWGTLGLLLLVFFVKVATYEASYYSEKEGSERVVVETTVETATEELIEVAPEEEEIREYVVAEDRPRYLRISKLNINNARILPMGVNAKRELDTPVNIFDVGWYDASGKPGSGGTLVIDGHNGGPHVHGVFKDLPSLVEGDIITVERGDGVVYNYSVVENVSVLLEDADDYMATAAKSPRQGKESVTLISCTGEWSQKQQTYLSRQFVRAVLVEQ